MDPLGEILNGTFKSSSNISETLPDSFIGSGFFYSIFIVYGIAVVIYWVIRLISNTSVNGFDGSKEEIVEGIEDLYECSECYEEWDSEEEAIDCCSEYSDDDIEEDEHNEFKEVSLEEDNKEGKKDIFQDGEDRIVW